MITKDAIIYLLDWANNNSILGWGELANYLENQIEWYAANPGSGGITERVMKRIIENWEETKKS